MKTDEYYMNIALNEAKKAFDLKEIPVGAIIVDPSGNIIGKGHNTKELKKNSIGHAEINAIIKANKKINNWRLLGCTMYVTLEPCEMCKKIINESRIKKVIYCTKNLSKQNNNLEYIQYSNFSKANSYIELLNQSFINIR